MADAIKQQNRLFKRITDKTAVAAAVIGTTLPALGALAQDGNGSTDDQQMSAAVVTQNNFATFSTQQDLMNMTEIGSHVLVQEGVNLNDRNFSKIQEALSQEHSNWFFVFVNDCTGWTFTNDLGTKLTGIKAADEIIDTLVRKNTEMSSTVDSKSGDQNGAYFSIIGTKDDIGFFYNGGAYYDKYIDKEEFKGDLGKPVYRIVENDQTDYYAMTMAAIDSVESTRDSRHAAAVRKPFLYGGAGAAALLVAGGAGVALRKRSSNNAKENYEEARDAAKLALDTKSANKLDCINRYQKILSDARENSVKLEGETLARMTQVTELVALLDGIEEEAEKKLAEAQKIAEEAGGLSVAEYKEATEMITTGEVKLSPKSDAGKALSGVDLEEVGFEAGLKAFNDIETTFEEMIAKYGPYADQCENTLKSVEDASKEANDTIKNVSTSLGRAKELHSSITKDAAADDIFTFPSFDQDFVPAVTAHITEAEKYKQIDPVRAVESCRKAQDLINRASVIMTEAFEATGNFLSDIDQGCEVLTKLGVEVDWIDEDMEQLSDKYDAALKTVSTGGSANIDPEEDFNNQVELIERAINIATERQEDGVQECAELEIEARDTRTKAAAKLNQKREVKDQIDAADILTEEDRNPTIMIQSARADLQECLEFLNEGELDSAQTSWETAERKIRRADKILETADQVIENHDSISDERKRALAELTVTFSDHKETLAGMTKRFDKEVLYLSEGDEAHPAGDRDISNNMEEVKAAEARVNQARQEAEEAYQSGALITYKEKMDRAEDLTFFVEHALGEITEKRAALDEAIKEVTALVENGFDDPFDKEADKLPPLSDRKAVITSLGDHNSTCRSTSEEIEKLCTHIDSTVRVVTDGLYKNPFTLREELKTIHRRISELERKVEEDRAEHADFQRSCYQADEALQALEKADSEYTATPSDAVESVKGRLEQYREEVAYLSKSAESGQHLDWYALDDAVDSLVEDLKSDTTTVERGLEQVEETNRSISAAKSEIKEIDELKREIRRSPSSYYGVTIDAQSEKSMLRDARSKRMAGEHKLADSLADNAKGSAKRKIEAFHKKVAQKKSEAEAEARRQAQERARRRREAAMNRQSTSSSTTSRSRTVSTYSERRTTRTKSRKPSYTPTTTRRRTTRTTSTPTRKSRSSSSSSSRSRARTRTGSSGRQVTRRKSGSSGRVFKRK